MNYNTYLFCCLLKHFNSEFDELPYDEQYDVVKEAYKKFKKSEYNNPNRSEYECMVSYLSDGKTDF